MGFYECVYDCGDDNYCVDMSSSLDNFKSCCLCLCCEKHKLKIGGKYKYNLSSLYKNRQIIFYHDVEIVDLKDDYVRMKVTLDVNLLDEKNKKYFLMFGEEVSSWEIIGEKKEKKKDILLLKNEPENNNYKNDIYKNKNDIYENNKNKNNNSENNKNNNYENGNYDIKSKDENGNYGIKDKAENIRECIVTLKHHYKNFELKYNNNQNIIYLWSHNIVDTTKTKCKIVVTYKHFIYYKNEEEESIKYKDDDIYEYDNYETFYKKLRELEKTINNNEKVNNNDDESIEKIINHVNVIGYITNLQGKYICYN